MIPVYESCVLAWSIKSISAWLPDKIRALSSDDLQCYVLPIPRWQCNHEGGKWEQEGFYGEAEANLEALTCCNTMLTGICQKELGGRSYMGVFPDLSRFAPFCPRLSSFVLFGPGRGQIGTKEDKWGQKGLSRTSWATPQVRNNRTGGTASLRSRKCVKHNAVFGARFKGLSLYFLYQKGNLTHQNGLGYTSDTYPDPYPLGHSTPLWLLWQVRIYPHSALLNLEGLHLDTPLEPHYPLQCSTSSSSADQWKRTPCCAFNQNQGSSTPPKTRVSRTHRPAREKESPEIQTYPANMHKNYFPKCTSRYSPEKENTNSGGIFLIFSVYFFRSPVVGEFGCWG